MREKDQPQFVDSMGRVLHAGDVVMIPGLAVKWTLDAVEIGSAPGQPPAIRVTAHAALQSIWPADQPVSNVTRTATAEEKKELDKELEAAQLRRAPSIHRPS